MHKQSQQKILDAGFILIDAKPQKKGEHQIWQKTKERPHWHILEKDIPTKAELKRRMQKLLNDETFMAIDLYDSLHRI